MNSMEYPPVFVLGTTNPLDLIDSALLRLLDSILFAPASLGLSVSKIFSVIRFAEIHSIKQDKSRLSDSCAESAVVAKWSIEAHFLSPRSDS